MEGNGPLNGTSRSFGKIVLADDPVAADTTCAHLMGFVHHWSGVILSMKNMFGILPGSR